MKEKYEKMSRGTEDAFCFQDTVQSTVLLSTSEGGNVFSENFYQVYTNGLDNEYFP